MVIRRWRPRRRRLLFVTGGSGFLGRHIVKGPESDNWEVLAPSSVSLDLRNRDSVTSVIGDWRPDAIIHTAYRRDNRDSVVAATEHVAEAAERYGARMVHVSTDALFAGQISPYTELDEPRPLHDYGRYKRDAERSVRNTSPTAAIVRLSILVGVSQTSATERAVVDAVSGHTPMTFFTDEIRCPSLVDDVAATLTEIAARPDVTGVLHLAAPEAVSRAELAVMTAERMGLDVSRLRFGTIEESGLTRPNKVVLDSSRARSLGLAVRGPRAWL